MNEDQARTLATALRAAIAAPPPGFAITELEPPGGPLRGFDVLRNAPSLGAFGVAPAGAPSMRLAMAEQYPKQRVQQPNWYVGVYPAIGGRTIAELWQVEHPTAGSRVLKWEFRPTLRDGKNELRKQRFQELNGSLFYRVPLLDPAAGVGADVFLAALRDMLQLRATARDV